MLSTTVTNVNRSVPNEHFGRNCAGERSATAPGRTNIRLQGSLQNGARRDGLIQQFFEQVENSLDLFFAHAGIQPGVPLADQVEHDLIWIRKEFHVDTRDHGKLIVHGHTPVEQATHYGNRINIDAGAGYGRPLVAVVFEGRACWQLTDEGRVALTP